MTRRDDFFRRSPVAVPLVPRLAALAVLMSLVAALGACSQSAAVGPATADAQGATPALSFTRFPDLPIPDGADVDLDRTMVVGAQDGWFGRLALTTGSSPGDVFDFYSRQLPNFGWEEVTALRSAVSVLTYARAERVATIQIQKRTLRGSEISVTVSPRGAPAAATGFGTTPAGSPPRVQVGR